MTVAAIVQARLGSARLPRKVLADLGGVPVLRVLLDRLSAARSLDTIVVAIPNGPTDDDLEAAIKAWAFPVVRGHPDDVLDRYRQAAQWAGADILVRVTGDCPLVDPRLVDSVVRTLLDDPSLDYVAVGPSFPDGADCEAFRMAALDMAWHEARLPSEREHVTTFINSQPERFSLSMIQHEPSLGGVRLTIDEPADLAVLRGLVGVLGTAPRVGIVEYAKHLFAHPALEEFRSHISRNEGLWRSRHLDELSLIGQRHPLEKSAELLARAERVIPGGTQTLSKGPDQFVRGVTPSLLLSGSGCHVTDVDGNIYIDYPMALGPVILGYGHPRTVEAVTRQVAEGTTFTLPHPLEAEVAEQLIEMVPSVEMVRFAKNGSDVTTAAVRLARAVTGRDVVLTCGYHGWHDWYMVQTPRNAGIPAILASLVEPFPFNDLVAFEAALARHDGRVAAVILEVGTDDPRDGFLGKLLTSAHRVGAIVIFDEIVTGFRFAVGGAQERYGVLPDLTCLGKAMANGLPLSAVGGRRDLMEEFCNVFFSGTFGGDTLALAAGKATLAEIAEAHVVEHMWDMGAVFRSGLTEVILASGLEVELLGHPPRSALVFRQDGADSPALRGLFLQEAARRGVLFGGPIFVTYAHQRGDVDRTVEICAEVFQLLVEAVQTESVERRLEGPAPALFPPLRS